MPSTKTYRGRFAPSPTGPLHFGSLIAATGSYLQSKQQKGIWLVRIDDIDPPREVKGAAKDILNTLEAFGFEWDEQVMYQSTRTAIYQQAVDELIQQHLAYPCSCSRTSIMNKTGQAKGNIIYPGFCRNGPLSENNNLPGDTYSIRLRCDTATVSFCDPIQGEQYFELDQHCGDFVLQRRDGYFSYHLATAIDDAEQHITEAVRGADLLDCTPQQIHVQKLLNLNGPKFCHLPVALNSDGQKLSKQNHAMAIHARDAITLLHKTLKFLGQKPPNELLGCNISEIWRWAINNWDITQVPEKSQENTVYFK